MAAAHVQNKSATLTAQTSHTVTLDAAPIAGNLLVACFRPSGLIAAVTLPTGWTLAVQDDDEALAFSGTIAYKVAGASESSAVTFTTTLPVNSWLTALEFSGVATAPLDKTAANDPSASVTSCATGSTGTLSQTAEVAVAYVACGALPSATSWDSGFTKVTTSDERQGVGYKVTAVATALNATYSWTTARAATGMIATFVAAAITGTAVANLGALTATATGGRTVGGTAVATLGGLTATATGTPSVLGTAVASLGGLASTASGTRTVTATAVATLGGLTATAAGTRTTTGTAAASLGPLTGTAAATRTVHATGTATLGGLTGTASGTKTVTGTAAAALGGLAGTATSTRTVHATANTNLGALTATATGTRSSTGTALAALGPLTGTASGLRLVGGTAAAPLGRLTAAATGGRTVGGVAVAALGGLSGTIVVVTPDTTPYERSYTYDTRRSYTFDLRRAYRHDHRITYAA